MSFLARSTLRTSTQYATRGMMRSNRLSTRGSRLVRGDVQEQFPGQVRTSS